MPSQPTYQPSHNANLSAGSAAINHKSFLIKITFCLYLNLSIRSEMNCFLPSQLLLLDSTKRTELPISRKSLRLSGDLWKSGRGCERVWGDGFGFGYQTWQKTLDRTKRILTSRTEEINWIGQKCIRKVDQEFHYYKYINTIVNRSWIKRLSEEIKFWRNTDWINRIL